MAHIGKITGDQSRLSARLTLRRCIGAILACAFVLAASPTASAQQAWPTRPVRFVVGFGPGGGTDVIARIVAQAMSDVLGQPVVVENKPGASSTVAADFVAKSPKDGYTVLVLSSVHAVSSVIYQKLPYDPINDFQMVSRLGDSAFVLLINQDLPANNFNELISVLRASPGKYNYATNGVGSMQHLGTELLSQRTNVKMQHIPFRGTPEAVNALQGKHVDVLIDLIQGVLGQAEAGTLKAVCVTSLERFPALPRVPSCSEAGLPGFNVTSWYGLALPAGTPAPIVEKLAKAAQEVVDSPKVQDQIRKAGALPKSSTPDELKTFVASEIERWGEVRRSVGIPQQ